jgi:AmpE protein
MASELTLIHGVPPDCDEREFLRELQNALLWINFRFYLAPLFWLIVGGPWGPVTLVGYAFTCLADLAGALSDAAPASAVGY